ncbi:GNAT family N-acetyltransferase [Herminiimonas arsenitoxidans]|uniref:GNAT family N-acetyltransferase n=1 Tax=Herminiimonas arsenitoxidans TaxID=1809410 RepID=UPI0009713D8F|nr:GNAT family N-acetyltransferase [Herminiimonas arsenitoxidans]
MAYEIRTGPDIEWQEVANLFEAVGWGTKYDELSVQRSMQAYPHVAYARDTAGNLIGYVTAFSDGAFSTMLGELVVHPAAQKQGVGKSLLATVEMRFPNVPVTVKALGNAKKFFEACGYRVPNVEVTFMFKTLRTVTA